MYLRFYIFLLVHLCSMTGWATGKPNILLIVSDDAGYADFGFQGCADIPTPHLDTLARGGTRLTQGYVAGPVCSPSRAALFTGKTPARIGHENNLGGGSGKGGVDITTSLLPAQLGKLGYKTGGIGKWHLGGVDAYLPWKRGFDEWVGFLSGHSAYIAKGTQGVKLTRNGAAFEEKDYLTDAFSREAVSFITRHQSEPWFLYLGYNAPHSPMQAPDGGAEKFPNLEKKRAVLAAMTISMDQGIGRVLDALTATGQDGNTLIVFINDNGGATYSAFTNTPLRGHKGTLFEGGIRVPFLIRWPGTIPAGRDFHHPVCATDLLPTFLAAAGAEPGTFRDSDGVDLLPFLKSEQPRPPHEALYWRYNVVAAVREGDWKLIRIRDNAPLLFNLATDQTESTNLAASEPARVKTLLQRIADWEKPFPLPSWTEGENWEKVHIKDHLKPPLYLRPLAIQKK